MKHKCDQQSRLKPNSHRLFHLQNFEADLKMYRNYLLYFGLVCFVSQVLVSTQVDGQSCRPLTRLNYTLFGEETPYDAARQFIEDGNSAVPKSFGENSLKEEHEKLVSNSSCNPIGFFFIGRHAASFPHEQIIKRMRQRLTKLIKNLEKRHKKCPEKLGPFMQWKSKFNESFSDLITENGMNEMQGIAKRFKQLYPNFFDVDKANITMGVTKETNTMQSWAEFCKEIDGYKFLDMKLTSFPTNNPNSQNYSVHAIEGDDEIYDKVLYELRMPEVLASHRICSKMSRTRLRLSSKARMIRDPRVVDRVLQQVSRRIGIGISPKTLESIYHACVYEKSMGLQSIWCDFFSRRDIMALEYIRDIYGYELDAYGPMAKPQQSCPLMKEIIGSFNKLMNETNLKRPEVHIYFTEASLMSKIFSVMGLFKDRVTNSKRALRLFVDRSKVPRKRNWRTSLATPLSANLALTLYRCSDGNHKILTSVTERPVQVKGCDSVSCDATKFSTTFKKMLDCDLESICRRKRDKRLRKRRNRDRNNHEQHGRHHGGNNDDEDNGRHPIVVRHGSALTIMYP